MTLTGAELTATVGIGHGNFAAGGAVAVTGPFDDPGLCWFCKAGDAAGVDPE